jgi:hypothetical protein
VPMLRPYRRCLCLQWGHKVTRVYEGLVRLRPKFCGKIDALGQNPPQSGPKCQGGGGITAHVFRRHAPDGALIVGAARICRGAVLERRAAT